MMRENFVRLVGLMAAVMSVAGCVCERPDDCQGLKVVIVSPKDGDTIASPAAIEVRGENDDGVIFDLGQASLSTGSGPAIEGTIAGSTATFADVQLAPGAQTLTATVTKKDTSCQAVSATVAVTVQDNQLPAKVLGCTFPQDANTDDILNNVEFPTGTTMQMSCAVENAAGTELVILRGPDVVGGPVAFSGQSPIAVSLTGLPDADAATYQLFAELRKGGVAVNNSTSNPEAISSIEVRRGTLTCANTTKALMGPGDDADSMLADFQLRATGTVSTDVVSATFHIGSSVSQPSTPVSGDVSGDLTVAGGVGLNTYRVVMEARDSVGNLCTAEKDVVVDLDPPTVSITSPAGGATVTTSPIPVTVQTSGVEDGQQACVYLQSAPAQRFCGAVMSGTVAIDLSVSSDGPKTLLADATDAAGNTSTSAPVNVTVALSGCAIGWSTIMGQPATCPAFVNRLNNGQLNVALTASSACAGQTFTISLNGSQVASNTTGNFAFPVSDGTYTMSAASTTATSISCVVTVDTSAPAILSPPTPMSGRSILNVQQDTQPGVAGAQSTLNFRPSSVAQGRIDVCVSQALPGTTGACAGTAGWFTLASNVTAPISGFTFPEGQYDIKIVVVTSVATTESAPVPLLVDVTRPCVGPGSLGLPQDTSMDGNLNATELGTASPQVRFDVDATCGSAATVSVRRAGMSTTYGSLSSIGANPVTVDLVGITSDGDYDLFVELIDAAGNRNVDTGASDPARIATRIVRTAPQCTITRPNAVGTLNIAAVPGGMLTVEVTTSPTVGANGVTMTVDTATQTATPAANVAQADFAVAGTRTLAIGATCRDDVGNTATDARSVDIDLDAPTCAIAAPTTGTYSTSDLTTTVTVAGADGRPVTITSSAQVGSLATLTVNSGTATGLVSYPNGTNQTITASVTDVAGNACSAQMTGVTVNSASCNLQITSGYLDGMSRWQNRNNTTMTGPTTGTANITASSTNCTGGQTVTLRRTVPSVQVIGFQNTNGLGDVTFSSVTLNDGETYEVEIDNGAGLLTTRPFLVDLVAPTAGAVTINATGVPSAPLFFVAQTGNRRVETMTAGYYADQDSAAGWRGDFSIAAVTGANRGADTGTAEVIFKGTTVATTPVATSPVVVSFQTPLPHDDTGALVVRVTDQAGNRIDVVTTTATIDVIAPATPTVTRNLADSRAATVTTSWGPVYDDGATSASGGVGLVYDIRWTTDLASGGVGLPDSAAFFGSTSAYVDGTEAWQSGTINRAVTVPPLNSYYIAVRARDEVYNYSAYGTAPAVVNNPGTQSVLVNPTGVGSQRFGQILAAADLRTGPDAGVGSFRGIGSVNADVFDDLVVGTSTTPIVAGADMPQPDGGVIAAGTNVTNNGAVYVYYGGAAFTGGTTCTAPACQQIVPYQLMPTSLFGADVAVGNVDTAKSDAAGRLDLIVGSPGYDASRGRVFVYFGTSAATAINAANYIEFRGADFGSRVGEVAKAVPDIDGDGIDELLVSARAEPLTGTNAGQGRIFIFKGRSQAQWQAARTATDPATSRLYVPVTSTSASWTLEGPLPVDTTVVVGNSFGRTRGIFSGLGDLNSDGRQDFAIGANKDSINKVYLYSGQAVAGATAPVPAPALLVEEINKGTSGVTTGFGTRVIGGYNIVGSSLVDLLVTSQRAAGGTPITPAACFVKVFPDGTATGFGSPSVTILGDTTRSFGAAAEVLDANGDGRIDIAVGEASSVSSSAWLFYQRSDGTFDASAGSGFWQSRSLGPATSRRGNGLAVGDFNGDGRSDLAVGDDLDSPGRIIVWQ